MAILRQDCKTIDDTKHSSHYSGAQCKAIRSLLSWWFARYETFKLNAYHSCQSCLVNWKLHSPYRTCVTF